MKSIELFTGAGGLALGIHLAGFRHQLLVEADKDAYATLEYNRANETVPGVSTWEITNDRVETVRLNNYGQIDLLAAGIPCQPFSNGGKRNGLEDERNMFPIFARALSPINPKAFLLENVNGLINGKLASHMEYIILQLSYPQILPANDQTWKEHFFTLLALRKSGRNPQYNVKYCAVNVADFGIPQIRKRVFIVGFRSDLTVQWIFPPSTHGRVLNSKSFLPWVSAGQAIADLPPFRSQEALAMQHNGIAGARVYKGHTGSSVNNPAKSLKAGTHGVGGGENMLRYRNGRVRYFSVRECARLQTFPDSWRFVGSWSSVTRQLGNAVPVKMAQKLALSIRDALVNCKT